MVSNDSDTQFRPVNRGGRFNDEIDNDSGQRGSDHDGRCASLVTMSVPHLAGTSFAGRVISQLTSWSAVRAAKADCGVGVGVGTRSGQFVHFHGAETADLFLTHAVIERMHEVLAESGRVLIRPGHDWVQVRLEADSDVALLVTLASLAIKANDTPPAVATRPAPCGAATARIHPANGRLRRLTRKHP